MSTWALKSAASGHNEQLIGEAIAGRRDEVVLATKFSARLTDDGKDVVMDGRPEYVAEGLRCQPTSGWESRLSICITAIGFDPKVPVEETVGAMARLIEQGKVRAIGLSETSVEQLRRAHGVQPLTALQSEYSLWETWR